MKIYSDASKGEAEDGSVVVDGPDGVDVKLTPEAAAETSDRHFSPPARPRRSRSCRENVERNSCRRSKVASSVRFQSSLPLTLSITPEAKLAVGKPAPDRSRGCEPMWPRDPKAA